MTDTRIHIDLSDVDGSIPQQEVLGRCYFALLNAGGLDGDWIEIVSEIRSRGWDALDDYFVFSPDVRSAPPVEWLIKGWTGNVLFDGKTFDSFEDGWGFIYENVPDEDRAYDEYYVVRA